MGFDVKGAVPVKLKLMRVADIAASSEVNAAMLKMAKQIQEKARQMAPVDYEDLIEGIQVRRVGVSAGGTFLSGMNAYEIYINGAHQIRNKKTYGDHTTIGSYAWEVHEKMLIGRHVEGQFSPSEESVARSLSFGEEAGGLFMDRACEKMTPKVYTSFSKLIAKEMKNRWDGE